MKLRNELKRLNSLERKILQMKEIRLDIYAEGCIFCGETENIKEYRGKYVCIDCIDKVISISNMSNN